MCIRILTISVFNIVYLLNDNVNFIEWIKCFFAYTTSFFLWWISGKFPFIVTYICQPHFKSLASVSSILYICAHYHFHLAGSYAPNSVFPNYILHIISSFLRSFRFLLCASLRTPFIHLLCHRSYLRYFFTVLKHHTIRSYGRIRYNSTHSCPVGKNGYWWERRACLGNGALHK